MNRKLKQISPAVVAILVLTTAACGGEAVPQAQATHVASAAPATASSNVTPDPGGRIITVEMVTDDAGNNKFVPATIDAKPGDVIRYKLGVGVHNVHFLPDSNPAGLTVPPAGSMLQMPGQTEDVKVTWGPGSYFFQCDPHALLGMVGHVNVK